MFLPDTLPPHQLLHGVMRPVAQQEPILCDGDVPRSANQMPALSTTGLATCPRRWTPMGLGNCLHPLLMDGSFSMATFTSAPLEFARRASIDKSCRLMRPGRHRVSERWRAWSVLQRHLRLLDHPVAFSAREAFEGGDAGAHRGPFAPDRPRLPRRSGPSGRWLGGRAAARSAPARR